MNKNIFTSLFTRKSTAKITASLNAIPYSKLPKNCGTQSLFYGVIREYSPKKDGFYLEQPLDLPNINLQGIKEQTLLGKTVVISGQSTAMYPTGSKPIDAHHCNIVLHPKILKVINELNDYDSIIEQCTATQVQTNTQAIY